MKIKFDGMYVKFGIFQSRAAKNAFLQSEKRPEFREKFSFSQSSSYCVKKPQFFDALHRALRSALARTGLYAMLPSHVSSEKEAAAWTERHENGGIN